MAWMSSILCAGVGGLGPSSDSSTIDKNCFGDTIFLDLLALRSSTPKLIDFSLPREETWNKRREAQTNHGPREREEGIIKLGMKTENEGEREKKRAGNALSCSPTVSRWEWKRRIQMGRVGFYNFCFGVVRTLFILGPLNEVGQAHRPNYAKLKPNINIWSCIIREACKQDPVWKIPSAKPI